jgi:ribosomal protein S14
MINRWNYKADVIYRNNFVTHNRILKLYKCAFYENVGLPCSIHINNNIMNRNGNYTRMKNYCLFSGRPRAVFKLFKLSRIMFKYFALHGKINGVRKASW